MLQLLLNYDESVRPPDGFTKSDSLHKRSFVFFTLCFAPAGRCLNSFQFHSQQPISWKSFLENSQNPLITTLIITSGKDEKYFSMFFFL